jgi:xanthine dehydrogenase accessory factor
MREIYAAIARHLRDGAPFVAATLVAARGAKASALGTTLLVDERGSFSGDIGAGCHEGAIVEQASEMLRGGESGARKLSFDIDDELLAGTGCGASLDVVLWRPNDEFAATAQAIGDGDEEVRFMLEGDEVSVPAKRRLAIVGATALAAELAALAQRADYRVAIVDPRPLFATRDRQGGANELVVAWPDDSEAVARMNQAGAIAILSHDVKLDLPALRAALASPARYIGLLGNRRVQAARRAALKEEGYGDEQLARIRGPAGLDLGAVTDGQTALSILAEVLAVENDRSGQPLSKGGGPIH